MTAAEMSDQEILRILKHTAPSRFGLHHIPGAFQLRNVALLATSDTLRKAPTYKEYEGHIGVGLREDRIAGDQVFEFVGFCGFGAEGRCGQQINLRLWSPSLDECIKAVNATLRSKTRKGYMPDISDDGLLTREDVLQQAERLHHLLDASQVPAETDGPDKAASALDDLLG